RPRRRGARVERLAGPRGAYAAIGAVTVRLAVFDCDGTLSDGQAAVCAAMDAAFAESGLAPADRHEVRRSVGLSLPLAIARLAPEAGAELRARVVDAYKQAFRRARLDGSLHEPLYEGIA